VGELPGPLRAHLDPLHRGDHAEHAAGGDHRVELDCSRGLRADQHWRRPGRPGGFRWLRDWHGQGWSWLGARNKVAGVAMSSAWCGRAWF
jgi:hypothetical protein